MPQTSPETPDLGPALQSAREVFTTQYAHLSDEEALKLYRREIVTVIPDALLVVPEFTPQALRELVAHADPATERKNWELLLAILATLNVMDDLASKTPDAT